MDLGLNLEGKTLADVFGFSNADTNQLANLVTTTFAEFNHGDTAQTVAHSMEKLAGCLADRELVVAAFLLGHLLGHLQTLSTYEQLSYQSAKRGQGDQLT
jgi:hypothetical protein